MEDKKEKIIMREERVKAIIEKKEKRNKRKIKKIKMIRREERVKAMIEEAK